MTRIVVHGAHDFTQIVSQEILCVGHGDPPFWTTAPEVVYD
jgi:hypothetical protein